MSDLFDKYYSFFERKFMRDGDVVDISEHGRVGNVASGQGFKYVSLINPVDGESASVQYPLPTDGDSVYAKDIWVEQSDMGDFSGSVLDLFDNLHSVVVNSETDNPKELTVHFNRTIPSLIIGIGAFSGSFSNLKVIGVTSGNIEYTLYDESSDDTDRTTRTIYTPTVGYNALKLQFHTADTVTISNLFILKAISGVMRIQGQKPDGTFTEFQSTVAGNFKMSLEEFESETFNASPLPVKDFLLNASLGNITGVSTIHKFGRNSAVGTSLVPVCDGGFYRTPTSPVTLEAISTSANDTAAGTGAQQVTLIYLDSDFVQQTATIEMNGTTATTEKISGVMRLFRLYVSRSGSYASASQASQDGEITIRVSGGGDTWAKLPLLAANFGAAQSLIGAYTIPAGKTAYILSADVTIDSNKSASLFFFKRENADDITTPYSGVLRVQNIYTGVSGPIDLTHKTNESFPEKTDIGFLATAAATSDVSVEFELLLVDN